MLHLHATAGCRPCSSYASAASGLAASTHPSSSLAHAVHIARQTDTHVQRPSQQSCLAMILGLASAGLSELLVRRRPSSALMLGTRLCAACKLPGGSDEAILL